MGSKRFSLAALLLSLVGGILAFFAGELILYIGREWPAFVKLGVYFGVGAMLIAAMVLISQALSPQLIGYRWMEQYFKTSLKLYIPTTLLMIGFVGGLFQFLYDMDINHNKIYKDIIIAIDTSGSMDRTDPQGERFKATSYLIDQLEGNRRVALMTFDDTAKLQIDFTEVKTTKQKEALKAEIDGLNLGAEGSTEVKAMINEAYNLISSQANSRSASLIMISDGNPTDDSEKDIAGLVSAYVADQIPISTIGMMYSDPSQEQYLIDIAALTGGQHFSTSNTGMLKNAFEQIKYENELRELVEARIGDKADSTLYAVLRIAFLGAIGLLIALGIGIMFDNRFLAKGLMIGGSIGALIGGASMEVLFKEETTGWLIRGGYWVVFGICLLAFTGVVTFKDSYHGTREV